MTIQTGVFIETFQAFGTTVRWASHIILSAQDHAAAGITMAVTATVFAWKGDWVTSLRSFFHFQQNWSYFENREGVIGGHIWSPVLWLLTKLRVLHLDEIVTPRIDHLPPARHDLAVLGTSPSWWRAAAKTSSGFNRVWSGCEIVTAFLLKKFRSPCKLCWRIHRGTCRNSSDKTDTLTQNIKGCCSLPAGFGVDPERKGCA